MKILLYIYIFGLAHVFSKNIENIDEKSDLTDIKSKNFDSSHPYGFIEGIEDVLVNDKFYTLLKRLGAFASAEENSKDTLKPEIQTLARKNLNITKDEEFLLEELSGFLKNQLTLSACSKTLVLICPFVSSYPGITQSLKELLEEKCKDPNATCEYALEKLKQYCDDVKKNVESITDKTKCVYYKKKCSNLVACKNGLNVSCKKMSEKCILLQNATKGETDSSTKGETDSSTKGGTYNATKGEKDNATKGGTDNATKYNESQKKPYGSQIVIDKTTLDVETALYTHKKILYGTKCCKDKSRYTKCVSTNFLVTSACSPTIRKTYSIDSSSEVDEISPQTQCSVTLTLTNKLGETFMKTITQTFISGDMHDKGRDRGHGIQTEKHQKLILFYMVIGIITGLLIIV
ncbi:hypothetical protein PNEG_02992 [Pneumocystis murina B123]|uniref:Uncharacterized protein n=1 Tax=Pneumocystis murina (strain B123) TaxID=1069680 RepID=M7PDH2_PNEMU|nr:hypothetical protein PNEG_02992 [Pneumocystis murina B123]EMR08509.1 hypothetical protein PNEG_02992 [Pneumocystis murina B123]